MQAKNKLVCGVGVNDAVYPTQKYENGKRVWICPYYQKWKSMLERCYRTKYLARRPTYIYRLFCM